MRNIKRTAIYHMIALLIITLTTTHAATFELEKPSRTRHRFDVYNDLCSAIEEKNFEKEKALLEEGLAKDLEKDEISWLIKFTSTHHQDQAAKLILNLPKAAQLTRSDLEELLHCTILNNSPEITELLMDKHQQCDTTLFVNKFSNMGFIIFQAVYSHKERTAVQFLRLPLAQELSADNIELLVKTNISPCTRCANNDDLNNLNSIATLLLALPKAREFTTLQIKNLLEVTSQSGRNEVTMLLLNLPGTQSLNSEQIYDLFIRTIIDGKSKITKLLIAKTNTNLLNAKQVKKLLETNISNDDNQISALLLDLPQTSSFSAKQINEIIITTFSYNRPQSCIIHLAHPWIKGKLTVEHICDFIRRAYYTNIRLFEFLLKHPLGKQITSDLLFDILYEKANYRDEIFHLSLLQHPSAEGFTENQVQSILMAHEGSRNSKVTQKILSHPRAPDMDFEYLKQYVLSEYTMKFIKGQIEK